MEHLEEILLHSTQIRDWTCRHPVLSKFCQFVLGNWSSTYFSKELQAYFSQRMGIRAEDGCLLWRTKVTVPSKGKSKVLAVLQEAHLGITRTKSLAHSYVRWQVKNCEKCQQNQKQPTEAPLHPWEWPGHPWSRLHVYNVGPFKGECFLCWWMLNEINYIYSHSRN